MRGDGAYLWQGFDHEWLRTALGFRLPHRISRLDSYIDGERHHGAGETWRSTAELRVAQATGVDGNYMRPVGYAAALWLPELRVARTRASFRWTDRIEGDQVPRAESRMKGEIEVDLGDVDAAGELSIAAVLRGLSLTSRCDPAKQPPELPCNSHGMWPYRLSIDLGDPVREGRRVRAPVEVELHRGWTPMKGGIPGVEEKPLNRCLDLELDVHATVLAAPPELLAAQRGVVVDQEGNARDADARETVETMEGRPGYAAAAVGSTRFGFELLPPSDKPRHRQRGRYLGGLRFRVGLAGYDPESGRARVDHETRLWVPRTVVPSRVRYQSRAVLLQLGDGARVAPRLEARGSLCSNSAAEAPFFSRWRRCGSPETGPEQTDDCIPISAP